MASDENVCRLQPSRKTMPNSQERSPQFCNLPFQGTTIEMVSRMAIFLRPEPEAIQKEITPIDMRSMSYFRPDDLRSMSYDDDVLKICDSEMGSASNFQIPEFSNEESNDENVVLI